MHHSIDTSAELGVTQLYHSTALIQGTTAYLTKGITLTRFALESLARVPFLTQ
jgi:hypothetical protein